MNILYGKYHEHRPNEIKWQLMMASCLRRSGNYQKAFEMYRQIHARFPENIECSLYHLLVSTFPRIPNFSNRFPNLSLMLTDNTSQYPEEKSKCTLFPRTVC